MLSDARSVSCNGVAILHRADNGLADIFCSNEGWLLSWSRHGRIRYFLPIAPAHVRAFKARKDWQPIDPKPGAMAA